MNQQQKDLIVKALDGLGDEDNLYRYKLAIKKGSAAYPRLVLEEFQESINRLEKRIALAESIKTELKTDG